jgi:drug/metabolite transporter (DMT)-like permease
MPTRARPSSAALWAAMLTIYVLWGSTYLGIAIVIESIPPFLMAAIRFAVAGVLLLAWEVLRNGRSLQRPTLRELRDSLIVGTLLLGVGNAFVGLGETVVPSGIAAVFIALIPMWFAVLGWLYFKERIPKLAVLGIGVGIVGVALLAWPFGSEGNLDPRGVAILILAPIGWSHGSLFAAHRAVLPSRPLFASGLQMFLASFVLLGEAVVMGEFAEFKPAEVTDRSLIALAYLIVFGSLVAYNAYTWLLRNAPLSLVSTYAYVNPVVAIALGSIFLAEPIAPRTLIASAVIVAAVAMIVTARGRANRAAEAPAGDAASDAGTTPAARPSSAPPPVAPAAAVAHADAATTPPRVDLSRAPAPRPGSSG